MNKMNKMNKKIVISSIASLLFLSQAANAEIKVGNAGVITGTIGVASQYVSKGLDANRDKPTASLTGEFASNSDIQLILGTGVFYSRPDKPVTSANDYNYELDYNVGLRKTFDKITLDLGYVSFTYPQATRSNNADTSAFYAKAGVAPTKETTFTVYYEKDDTGGAKPISTTTQDYFYEISLSHNFGPAAWSLAYGNFHDSGYYYKTGLAKEIMNLNFTVDYIKNYPDDKTWTSSLKDRDYVVVGVSKTF